MSSLAVMGLSLALMILALPITAVAGQQESTVLYVLGLAVFAAGALIPPVTRYVGPGSDDAEEDA